MRSTTCARAPVETYRARQGCAPRHGGTAHESVDALRCTYGTGQMLGRRIHPWKQRARDDVRRFSVRLCRVILRITGQRVFALMRSVHAG